MAKHESDLRFFSNDEINELKNYFHKNGWKYSNLVPSRILKNGIPRTYTKSGFNLPINNSLRYIHRWQIIELLAYGKVIHSKEDCTSIYKPKPDEIRAYHATVKARRASADILEGVVDREVVSEGIQTAKAAVEAPKALETEEAISCLYFSSVNMNPSNNLIEILFVEEETWRTAKVSSHHDRSFCALKDLPTGILCTSQRFEILKRDILDYLKSHDGGADSHWHFSGTVDSEGFLTEITGH